MTNLKNILNIILVLGVFALHPSLNKGNTPITYLQHYVYGNTLSVNLNETIDKNLLEIKWLCEPSDNNCHDLIIFQNGKQVNKIPSVEGNQMLVVFYKGIKMGELPQNKIKKNQAHEYNVSFSSKNNALFFKGYINGPSPYYGTAVSIASL